MIDIKSYLDHYKTTFDLLNIEKIEKVVDYMKHNIGNVYTVGNGGSAALAEHFSQDWVKRLGRVAIPLTNISNITAYSNDISYNDCFSKQLEVYGKQDPGCLVCFSSSGNSVNIYNAGLMANKLDLDVVSFTGFSGGKIRELSKFNIHVPSYDYGIVESTHSILFHYIISRLEEDK